MAAISLSVQSFPRFRRFRLTRKATLNFALSARLSACIRAAASGWISVKFDNGETFTKICRETPDFFKIGQQYFHFHEDLCMIILFSIEWGKNYQLGSEILGIA
jgi:hypothetical protein